MYGFESVNQQSDIDLNIRQLVILCNFGNEVYDQADEVEKYQFMTR